MSDVIEEDQNEIILPEEPPELNSHEIPYRGTVSISPNFIVENDALDVKRAIADKDENLLIHILCNRSVSQRIEIVKVFELSGLSETRLTRCIKDAFGSSSYFSLLMTGLAIPLHEYLTRTIHDCYTYRWILWIMIVLPNKLRENICDNFQASK